jgi:hypothetical protein
MPPDNDVLMRTADLRKRYGGCSAMWIERRLSGDPTFPRPIYIAKRRFWRLADIVAWEATKAAA